MHKGKMVAAFFITIHKYHEMYISHLSFHVQHGPSVVGIPREETQSCLGLGNQVDEREDLQFPSLCLCRCLAHWCIPRKFGEMSSSLALCGCLPFAQPSLKSPTAKIDVQAAHEILFLWWSDSIPRSRGLDTATKSLKRFTTTRAIYNDTNNVPTSYGPSGWGHSAAPKLRPSHSYPHSWREPAAPSKSAHIASKTWMTS